MFGKKWHLVRYEKGITIVAPNRFWRRTKAVNVAAVLNSRGGFVGQFTSAIEGTRWFVVNKTTLKVLEDNDVAKTSAV